MSSSERCWTNTRNDCAKSALNVCLPTIQDLIQAWIIRQECREAEHLSWFMKRECTAGSPKIPAPGLRLKCRNRKPSKQLIQKLRLPHRQMIQTVPNNFSSLIKIN